MSDIYEDYLKQFTFSARFTDIALLRKILYSKINVKRKIPWHITFRLRKKKGLLKLLNIIYRPQK